MFKKLSLLFFSVFLLLACKNSLTKKEKTAADQYQASEEKGTPATGGRSGTGFNITAPEGWTKTDTFLMGNTFTILKSPEEENDNFLENVNVVTEAIGETGFDEYVEKSIVMLRSGLKNFTEGELTERTINALHFKKLTYSHNYNGQDLDVNVYWTINEQKGYVITCTTTKGNLSKWQPVFDKIVQSFSFN